jgi:hypothetical protein
MSDISMSSSFNVSKGTLKRSYSRSDTADFVASAPVTASGTASIATSSGGEALVLQDVSSLGWARFENLDTTNYVEVGVVVSATFYPFLKLLAGEYSFMRLSSGIAPYARANTAAVQLDYEIFQA